MLPFSNSFGLITKSSLSHFLKALIHTGGSGDLFHNMHIVEKYDTVHLEIVGMVKKNWYISFAWIKILLTLVCFCLKSNAKKLNLK